MVTRAIMLTTRDIMTRDFITVSPDTEIAYAAKILLEKGINGLPVIDEKGKLIGIICQSDLIAQQKRIPLPSIFTILDGFIPLSSKKRFEKAVQKISATTVAHAMTPDPVTVSPDTSIEDLSSLMVDKNFHTLPVEDEGKLVGIVGKADILRILTSSEGTKENRDVK